MASSVRGIATVGPRAAFLDIIKSSIRYRYSSVLLVTCDVRASLNGSIVKIRKLEDEHVSMANQGWTGNTG